MSGFLRTVSTVAGVVALAATGIGAIGGAAAAIGTTAATVAKVARIATLVAVTAGVGAQLTARRPAAQGSSNEILIGATLPAFEVLGQSYVGGSRVHLAGYGTQNDVPNAYLIAVDVYGVGGPYQELVAQYGDFTPITFSGGAATGYYSNDTLYSDYQLGATPESDALAPHFVGAPDWGSAYKLSGKPAILWNARFPKDGKRFGSGFFQTGAEWKGSLAYDPRLDSTYVGGSGSHRWASPADHTAFASAKSTWEWSDNPAIRALRYALGTWERDETDSDAEYVKVFGIGIDFDAIIVEDFVTLANVCDDNSWKCNGVVYETGQDGEKWENLKRILQSAAAESCFRGGKLGLRINAPRVALDTITRDDIADGEISIPAMQGWRDRLNTLWPKYRSPDHKWEYVTTQAPVQVTEYVTEDGGVKSGERQKDLVTDPDQAAQLVGYDLVNGRAPGAIELPLKPRFRFYGPGDLLTIDLPEPETELTGDFVVIKRTIDPATMIVTMTLMYEDPDKHSFALSRTGTAPPAITIQSPEDIDDVGGAALGENRTLIATSTQIGLTLTATDTTIVISDHVRRYSDGDVSVDGDTLTGLTAETQYYLYYDDLNRAGGAVTYHATEDYFEAFLSDDNPSRHFAGAIVTDVSGGGGTNGSGALPPGGGGASPYEPREIEIDGQVPLA